MSSVTTSASVPNVIVFGGSAGGMNALKGIFETFDQIGNSIVVVVLHRDPKDHHWPRCCRTTQPSRSANPTTAPGRLRKGWSRWPRPDTTFCSAIPEHSCQNPDPGLPLRERHWVRTHLTLDPPVAYSRPSLNVTFSSAAELVNPVTVVLLSCANDDGARGCEVVKASGEEWCSRIRPRARRPPRSTRRCARCNRTSLPIRGRSVCGCRGTPLGAGDLRRFRPVPRRVCGKPSEWEVSRIF